MSSSSIFERNLASTRAFYISPKIEIVNIQDINELQQGIIDIIKRLEGAGKITIQRGGIVDELI
ncbi:MAG: hypothetical protein PHV07_01195 [Oscillospiraceae bacterium]|nr:hypothetical protein [Oscillospiraceae bacterium]